MREITVGSGRVLRRFDQLQADQIADKDINAIYREVQASGKLIDAIALWTPVPQQHERLQMGHAVDVRQDEVINIPGSLRIPLSHLEPKFPNARSAATDARSRKCNGVFPNVRKEMVTCSRRRNRLVQPGNRIAGDVSPMDVWRRRQLQNVELGGRYLDLADDICLAGYSVAERRCEARSSIRSGWTGGPLA